MNDMWTKKLLQNNQKIIFAKLNKNVINDKKKIFIYQKGRGIPLKKK